MYLALERYSRPATVEECLALMAEAQDEPTALVAGGTELNVRGHEELVHLIDIQALPFKDVRREGDVLRVGSLVTLSRVRREAAFADPLLEALREAAAGFAVVALQNRRTLGGRVYTDRGDEDVPPVLAALGTKLRLLRPGRAGARGVGAPLGRTVDEQVVDYPLGAAQRRALRGALLAELLIPMTPGKSAYRRFSRTAVDAPLANAAVVSRPAGMRLAVNLQGARAAHLKRLADTEDLIASWNGPGAAWPAGWRQAVRLCLMTELEAWGDAWASGEYRQDVTATLVVRALARVIGEKEVE